MKNRYCGWIGKTLLFLSPLFCGMAGFVILEKQPFLDSLYQCVGMYVLDYGDTPSNILLEIARWAAPLVTASSVIMAVAAFRTFLVSRIHYLKGDSVAVYGPENEKAALLTQLGGQGIDGKDRFVLAQRYILVGTEEENFAFYDRHRESLRSHKVYLQCSSLQEQAAAGANLKLFSPEETAARLFWKQCSLYEESVKKNHHLKIVLLGFEKLGEEVLRQGLLNNLFSPGQRIEYHIFGDGDAFLSIHSGISHIEDPIIFYREPWYQRLELMESADLILLLTQEKQAGLLGDLLLAVRQRKIAVFSSGLSGVELLEERERFSLFEWREAACKPENIMEEALFERAKRINGRYASLYQGVQENEETREALWQELDAFTRYSNISSADYHEVRLNMLKVLGEPADAGKLSPEVLELLSELEHIRWCRYHYLNNWSYGVPADGKNKDKVRRIHTDLIPYRELSEEDKEKDRENIRILLSVPEGPAEKGK